MSKCSRCVYRSNTPPNLCDYILITGHSRGCPPGDKCTEFRAGASIERDFRVSGRQVDKNVIEYAGYYRDMFIRKRIPVNRRGRE